MAKNKKLTDEEMSPAEQRAFVAALSAGISQATREAVETVLAARAKPTAKTGEEKHD